ncbi:MAG: sulfurtransferase complex subunit TusC [Pseudomonadota bacterium]
MSKKRIVCLNRRAPHGTNYPQEGFEVALIGAAFDQDVAIAFVDDGVFQLKSEQNPRNLGLKNFTRSFGALADYEICEVYVEIESLTERGLVEDDLMTLIWEDEDDGDIEKPLLRFVGQDEMSQIISEADVVLNF